MTNAGGLRNAPTLLGLFLISAGILALEVLHMRILSVQMWYHHAYIIVTMAMLGFAVSGTIATIFPGVVRGNVAGKLAWCSTLFGVLVIVAHMVLPLTLDSATEMSVEGSKLGIAAAYLILLVPYFFGGMVITLALSASGAVHSRYFLNLVGSAVGSWLFIVAITPLGGERLLVVCSALGPVSALCFAWGTGNRAALGGAVVALLAAGGLFVNSDVLHIEVGAGKKKFVTGETIDERWTPLSRLDVAEDPKNPIIKHVLQDGVGGTYMYSAEHWQTRPLLDAHSVAFIPHIRKIQRQKAEGPDALIIGIGGGSDLRAAVDYGAKSVLGIEINEEMTRITGVDYADFNGNLYDLPGVEVVVGEGRSTLRRLDRKFDVIQLAGADTYTAGASGSFVLSESYLYTNEALSDYFDHLEEGGTLGILRFYDEPARETIRIFGMALLELRRRGIKNPSRHAVVSRDGWASGTVFSLTPFEEADIALFAEADKFPPNEAGDRMSRTLFLPGRRDTNHEKYQELADAIEAGTEDEFYASYEVDVRPISDDAPFFFNFHHIWDWVEKENSKFGELNNIEYPVAPSILRNLLIQVALLVLALVLLPLLALRRSGLRAANATRHMLFFCGVGAGFMLLEISMIQRLVLFLGHPTYSLTVVLFCFLFFAGLGSAWSGRFVRDQTRGVRGAVIAICLISVAYLALLPMLLGWLLQFSLTVRVLASICLLAPLNFVMGMPFPLALSRLKSLEPQLVPWAIGANGGASVIGSILAVIIAMETGFTIVGAIALGIYAIGMIAATTGPLASRA